MKSNRIQRWRYALFHHWYANNRSASFLAFYLLALGGCIIFASMSNTVAALKLAALTYAALLAGGWLLSVRMGLQLCDRVGVSMAFQLAGKQAIGYAATYRQSTAVNVRVVDSHQWSGPAVNVNVDANDNPYGVTKKDPD